MFDLLQSKTYVEALVRRHSQANICPRAGGWVLPRPCLVTSGVSWIRTGSQLSFHAAPLSQNQTTRCVRHIMVLFCIFLSRRLDNEVESHKKEYVIRTSSSPTEIMSLQQFLPRRPSLPYG